MHENIFAKMVDINIKAQSPYLCLRLRKDNLHIPYIYCGMHNSKRKRKQGGWGKEEEDETAMS